MDTFLAGSLAGFTATAPMTAIMVLLHRQLHWYERHPLPPEDITEAVTKRVGMYHHLSETQHDIVTWTSHFAFGATAGALYTPIAERVEAPPALKGAAFGLAVWASSYLGLLPAAGILHQTVEQPARPNLLMIAAHLVWGASLGILADRWKE
jgi:uncharacterized membrane protein YagU involved in acid resistance